MTSSECKSKINSTIECPVTYVNNNQKQMNIGRPPSSISLITDQLKLSSLNERDSYWRSGSKDYHHSRTVHFHDVFAPSSSVCSSLRSTMSEFEDGNEIVMNNGSRISWHHPLFNFGSGAAQTKCSNNNGNNLSSQTEVSEVTLQHNNSPTDFPQAHSDNLQKSVRLRNRTTHSNSSGGSSIHNNNSNNKSQFDRVHHRPSHIEIKDSQYSSLSIHALPSPSSAFTPTRASFGSFPMDVNSSEFSLSPTTESISSSIQITTRTPSSGFHEASFFGLSEASSLPDCSRVNSGPSSNHHCNCNCHQRRQQHYHHHHRRNQTNISIDNKSLNQSGNMSSKLTDLEPCFKLEDSEPNINDNHQSRNTSSSSSSSNSDSSSYCCSYSLPSVKCMLRCCSQPNDDTIYDINYRHSPHCSRTLKHIHQSPTTTTTTTNTTTCTFFTTISTTAMMITTKTSTTTSSNITIANTAAGLKRRRGPSGECNNQYCRDTDFHNESNNYHHHTHEEERKQLLAHEELLPCNCCMFKRTTDQLKNNHDGKSLSDIEHLNYMSTILSNNNATLIESDIHDEHYHYLSSTASSIKHCTQPNLKNTTLMMDNNENGKITEAVNDNSCSVANSLRNPCYISSYEHCSSVFSEENLIHRYTYNELGKLYEMTEDEKEHETPETMIDENSNNGRISETNYHHPIILLSSPPIHEIAFTPIHPSTNIEWDNSDDRNSDSCRIPVHNHPDVLLNESVDTNLKDDSTGRQVLLFTPSSTSSNSDRESDDMKSILSPQTPNRQRTCSDILQEKSNNNKQTLSFTDLDLELIEND
ncbi:hypothetical protein Smp_178990 [Schistosoma mansoni]|uniref:hypothetical protein n=1 Tax=Schistosoma mansoni TaxID=6183 RepID=UPI00019B3729|nr:hypothetical protein Smp_178990 [Schistosoma mansoni]|eukprot:XP_018650545.1 hypothetical protein Smp_178990 [Schistosoma mansoni]